MRKNKLKIQKAAFEELIHENIIDLSDLVIYVGGRFGEDCGASFMEISTADKLFMKPPEN
jgi:pyruvate kinase